MQLYTSHFTAINLSSKFHLGNHAAMSYFLRTVHLTILDEYAELGTVLAYSFPKRNPKQVKLRDQPYKYAATHNDNQTGHHSQLNLETCRLNNT